ncbi:MAG: YjjG family noncanonical pyrimidine nucleotidase [Paludibacteraceae bacterium]|nr:YjjG family noncanonical pyrimidine nucleotidase [Paludibacteraceae bacterium]
MKNYKAILIDWDQTIGDWNGAELQSQQDLYTKYRLSEWFESFDAYFQAYKSHNKDLWIQYGDGKVTSEYLQRDRFLYPLLQALQLDFAPKKIVEMADKMGKDFLELTNKYFSLLPDAKEVVQQLASRYPLTIISNGFSSVQYYKIAHSGLKPYFTHVVLSEEVGVSKPQVGIFEKALQLNGVKADEAIMIGDSYPHDIVGARNAGIDQIWVQADQKKVEGLKQQEECTATYEVTNLADVLTIL